MRQKRKITNQDFKSPMDPATVAKGLNELPRMNDALRLAGMQDGIGLAKAKAKSAERAALRAKLRKDPLAEDRAKRARAEAEALAASYTKEVARVKTGLGDVLDPEGNVQVGPNRFELSGVVMNMSGV